MARRDRVSEVQASFEEFVHARTPALGRTAYLLLGDWHLAEDLVQSALGRAAAHWERLDEPEAYVRRALYTQAVSWWRRRRSRPLETLTDGPPPEVGGRNPGGDVETRLMVRRALARLTVKQRAVLVLRFYEDRSEIDTARLLGCSVGTVKSQTRHALRRLRKLAPELATLAGMRESEAVTAR